jgi:DNA polymerase zeta
MGRFLSRIHRAEKRLQNVHRICHSCSATPQSEPVHCESVDCHWLFERKKVETRAEGMNLMHELLEELIELHMDEDNSTGQISEVPEIPKVSIFFDSTKQ